jgi:hypothetical protein
VRALRGRRRDDATAQGALDRAEALVDDGRPFDAIAVLTTANRANPDPRIEQRLIRLRHDAFAGIDKHGGEAEWPPRTPDVFGDGAGLPEVSSHELDAASLRSGILRHGALVVRNLITDARAGQLIEDIDRAFTAYDANHEGMPDAETAPWYLPFEPTFGASLGPVRELVHNGGGVLTVESPRSAAHVIDAFDEIALAESLGGFLGDRPVLSGRKWTLRRVPPDSTTSWHQDGAFLGHDIRAVNVWLALSACGDDAPSLDVVPRRFDEILPSGTEGAIFTSSVGEPVVARAAEHAPIQRPIFAAGDALLFDELFLHRTGVAAGMTRSRYAIESWFFAASHFPGNHIPILL